MPPEVLLAAALALTAAIGLPQLWRKPRGPGAMWIGGWIAAGAGGVFVLYASQLEWLAVLNHAFGSMFAVLLLAGTFVWIGRPKTRSLVFTGLAIGAVRLAAAVLLGDRAAYTVGLFAETPLVFAAGVIAWRHPAAGGPRFDGRWLALSFWALTVLGVGHLLVLMQGHGASRPLFALWVGATPALFGVHIAAAAAWLNRAVERARDELEVRIAERTRELAAANASLRASEERWRGVSQLGSDLAFAFRVQADDRAEGEWITDAVEQVTGFRADELADGRWLQLLAPEDYERILAQVTPLRATGGQITVHPRIRRKDGAIRWLEVRLRVEKLGERGAVRVVGASRDITQEREAELASRRFEQRIQESQRFESLGLLTGGIAHDFNNLLTVVLGNARLAHAEIPEDGPLRQRLARIRAAAEHGAALTEQMIVYAGRGSHVRKPANLSRLVEDMLELARASLPGRCALEHGLERDVWAEVDETQIRQVVLNLVTNAAEAMGGAPGTVWIRTGTLSADAAYLADADAHGASDAEPGRYAWIQVSDDGPGMDTETLRRVFDPFFTTKFSGRGLGLSAVLGIVRGHGGIVKAASSLGRGSTFRALFPGAGQPLAALRLHDDEVPPPARLARPARVLVVDDEDAVLEIADQFLTLAGFEVVPAGSGTEALELFRAEPERFDAAVIDLTMPDLGGEHVAADLRALRPDLPLVLASGYSAERAAAHCLELGEARFLRKPYAPDDLLRALQEAIEQISGGAF